MRKLHRLTATMALLTVIIVACGEAASDDSPPETLTVIAHDSFASAAAEIGAFDGFTEETGIGVEVIAAGDAGSLVNQAVLTKDNPLADVLFGVDDTFLTRALDEEIFVSYRASLTNTVDDALLRADNLVTPIDFGDVCINYDKQWFDDTGTPIPSDLDDLRSPDLAQQLTVEHPATSSPGLAFMFATIEEFGEPGWLDFWADLRDGQVNVVSDWDSAYYGAFIPYGGQSSMVVSYASSPPAEVIFATEPTDVAPTGVIEAGCYRQVEYAGILDGTRYPEAAGHLIDYMLGVGFQETIPLTWFVFPANLEAALPPEFVEYTIIPKSPVRFDSDYIAENRDGWIDEWIEVMESQ